MLRLISIDKGWTKWAGKEQGPPIEPGIYYVVEMGFHTDKATKEKLKNELGLIAATGPGCRFCWLAAGERWVKRVLDGCIKYRPEPGLTEKLLDYAADHTDISRLRPWQAEVFGLIVRELTRNGEFRRLVHVSLGGGKTLLGLLALSLGDHGLVLAPSHVHETWKSEAEKWGVPAPTISTYESAYKLADREFDVLVCDELHKCKNPEAARHEHTANIAHRAPVVVGLTASPTGGGGPFDWRSLRVIEHGSVPASEKAWRYLFGLDTKVVEVAPGRKAYQTTTWDIDKIKDFVAPWVTSIDTSDLLSQLPDKTEQIVTLPTPKDYALVQTGASTSRNKSKLTAQLRQATDGFVELDDGNIVELADQAKLDWIVDTVEHLGEPVVIYAAWRHSVNLLSSRLARYAPSVIEGGSGDVEYQITRFKRGETAVLIANAGFSEGMNLQENCRQMIFMSLSSNPTNLNQAIGRIHRPGQMKGVNVTFLQCKDTIDRRAYELVRNHQELSQAQIEKLLEEID